MYTYKDYEAPRRTLCATGTALARPAVAFAETFCAETSMHGFRHIAEPARHWAERLLWIAATTLAIWGAVHVSLGQLQRYNESPTVVTLEKDFRSWRFSLPGVTACKKNRTDPSKLEEVIKDTWNVDPSDEKYEYYSRFVMVVTDSDLLHLEKFEEFKDDEDLDVDLYQLAVDVMPDVEIKLTLQDSVFLKWIPVMTEAGACYSVNSLAIDDVSLVKPNPNDTALYPITCKYGGTSCYLMLSISVPYDFYYHSPYDVLDINQPATSAHSGAIHVIDVSVTETGCGRGVKDLSPARRACLFIDEPAAGRKVYSTNSCRLSCRSKVAMKLCGCRPFYYFYDDGPACKPSGMACLSAHSQQLSSIGGVKCPCTAQCLNSMFREVTSDYKFWNSGTLSMQGSLKYVVQPPKIRYTREIVFHFQDLIVSFGGAAGLFLGASFISFVEIIYFVLERILGAMSVKTQVQPVMEKTKKTTFEAQRLQELTRALENNPDNGLRIRNTHF